MLEVWHYQCHVILVSDVRMQGDYVILPTVSEEERAREIRSIAHVSQRKVQQTCSWGMLSG